MPRSNLSKDLVRDYWRQVRDLLTNQYRVAPAVATVGVRRFRRKAIRAGDTIYNRDPERVADAILEWIRSATTLIPTPADISQIPRWAALAFAGRCARRVQPIYRYSWKDAPDNAVQLLATGVNWAEQVAVQRPASLFSASMTAADQAAQLAMEAHILPASLAAMSAASAGRGAPIDSLMQAVNSFVLVATSMAPVTRQLHRIRRDFDHLVSLAREHHWTDETPVPPEVFGPMWPSRLTPVWATEPPGPPQEPSPGLVSLNWDKWKFEPPMWPSSLVPYEGKALPAAPTDPLPPS